MDCRRQIERWFAARGVPQLIEGYSTEQRMDARAVPFIVAWLVIGTFLIWGRRPRADLGAQILVSLAAVAVILVVLGLVLLLRRHPPFRANARLDLLDIALIGLVPSVVAAVVRRQPIALLDVLGVAGFVLLGVGLIYLVFGFGLLEIGWWALGHLRTQLTQILTLLARTLPVLLILVVFLLFASELWQAAHMLGGADLVAIIVLLLLVASLLVVTRARAEIGRLEETERAGDAVATRLAGTPAEPLAGAMLAAPPPRRLRWLERINLVFLMLLSQLLQSLFVGLLVTVFLVALGVLAIPASVQEQWVGEPVRTVRGFELLGEPRLVSTELLVTAGLLGGMCALYFTGLALTDAAYRAEFHARVVADVEEIMAVHAAYLASPEVRRS
jgi:hypothetical protein